jgi:transcriptional regulator with XRE-family HTH domain
MVKSQSPKRHMQAAPGARGQTFAQLLRAARIKHGLTQRELAERLGGMRQPKVAMLESGERHPPRSQAFYAQLREVFDAFEVDAIIDSILAELPWATNLARPGLRRSSVESSPMRHVHVEVKIHADPGDLAEEELDRLQQLIDADVRLRLATL